MTFLLCDADFRRSLWSQR